MVKRLYNGIYNLILGMITTSKHFLRGNVTVQYPTEKWEMPERSRGIVVLLSDKETGKLNCTTCLLCMRACPCGAIQIANHKDEETKKRVLDDFVVDHTICCFCGLCEESCNFAAIKLATYYENSTYSKEELIHHTQHLQELGRDVPYEKPVRKKKVVKKPAVAPAAKPEAKPEDTEKPAEPKPEEKPVDAPSEEKPTTENSDQPAENKDNDKPSEEQK